RSQRFSVPSPWSPCLCGSPVSVRERSRTLLTSQSSTSMHPVSPHLEPFHDLRFGGEEFVPAIHHIIGGHIFLCKVQEIAVMMRFGNDQLMIEFSKFWIRDIFP